MSEHTPSAPATESVAHGHEVTDVQSRPLLLSALTLCAAVAVVCAFLHWFIGALERNARRHDPQLSPLVSDQAPPAPRLQTDPASDLAQMRAAEDRALTGYRWINKEAGVVRLPIDRAMDLLLEQGLPATSDEVPRVDDDGKQLDVDGKQAEERRR